MANLKETWHNIVARNLLQEYDDLEKQLNRQIQVTKEHVTRWTQAENMIRELKKTIRSLRQENESLKNTDPMGRTLDVARHHASQIRIRDLEAKLRRNNIEPQ